MNTEELIHEGRMGNKEAIAKLYENNHGIMLDVVHHLANPGYDFDDLFQLCGIGLMKAVRTYIPDKAKFTTYLAHCCKIEILAQYRHDNTKSRGGGEYWNTKLLTDVVGYGKLGDPLTYEDILTEDAPYGHNAMYEDTLAIVRDVLHRFSPSHQKVIMYCTMMEGRQTQAVYEFGYSQSRISRIVKSFREQLDQELLKHGIIERSILEDFQGKKLGRPYRKKVS